MRENGAGTWLLLGAVGAGAWWLFRPGGYFATYQGFHGPSTPQIVGQTAYEHTETTEPEAPAKPTGDLPRGRRVGNARRY